MLYGWGCKQLASTDTRRLSVCFDQKRLIISLRSPWFLGRQLYTTYNKVTISYILLTTKSTFSFSSHRGQLTSRFKLYVCSVISKWLREKQISLETLSSAVVGVEALWCHLDCFSFQNGWIGLECNGIGSPCIFILSLL